MISLSIPEAARCRRPAAYLLLLFVLAGCCKTDEDKRDYVSAADEDFMRRTAVYHHNAAAAGELAVLRSTDDAVKELGRTLASDCRDAQQLLTTIAADMDHSLPDHPDTAYLTGLSCLSGRTFDTAWIRRALADGSATLTLMEAEAAQSTNVRLMHYAKTCSDQIRGHCCKADSLLQLMP